MQVHNQMTDLRLIIVFGAQSDKLCLASSALPQDLMTWMALNNALFV